MGVWRAALLPDGSENPEFILNREPYRQAEILVTGPNFGCGSSREGAVWSLQEMGIRAVIGSSFGDIFFANCFQNGILPIIVDKAIVDGLAAEIELTQGAGRVGIDLEEQTIISPTGKQLRFEIEPTSARKAAAGLDEVALTLRRDDEIRPSRPPTALRGHGSILQGKRHEYAFQYGQGRRDRWRRHRPRGDGTVAADPQLVCGQARRSHDVARGAIWHHSLSCDGKVLARRYGRGNGRGRCDRLGATGGPETRRCLRPRASGQLVGINESKYDLYANLRPIVANPALADSAPLKAHVL